MSLDGGAPERPKFLTPDEAADLLRTTVKTLAKWRSQGGGPTFLRAGRKILYRESDLLHFVTKHASTWDDGAPFTPEPPAELSDAEKREAIAAARNPKRRR